jgi:hypothetical protein
VILLLLLWLLGEIQVRNWWHLVAFALAYFVAGVIMRLAGEGLKAAYASKSTPAADYRAIYRRPRR